ncbi:MAG TPA: Ig-like domain repeat protein [Candidatus Acidoferrales bacterium]|nr:Ig-like domain repeat protein [Candidatus Acidoferrales bacterium]
MKIPQASTLPLTATISPGKTATGLVTFTLGYDHFAQVPVAGEVAQTGVQTDEIGTYVLSTQYSGDVNDLASQSGNLSVAFTGTTQQQIVAQTGTLAHSITVNVTVQ